MRRQKLGSKQAPLSCTICGGLGAIGNSVLPTNSIFKVGIKALVYVKDELLTGHRTFSYSDTFEIYTEDRSHSGAPLLVPYPGCPGHSRA